MPRKDFAAFTRLDASDVNTYLMDQSVQTFAGTAARGSAIATPIEGMYTHLEDTDSLEFWNGSAWTAPFALNLIKTQTIGTAVSSVVVTNAFSATYDSYKIIVSGGVATDNQNMRLRLGSTSTGYYSAGQNVTYAAVSSGVGSNNASLFTFVGYGGTNTIHANIDITNPFQAKRTVYSSARVGPQVGSDFIFGGGFLNDNTSYTDFTISPVSGTYTGGTIHVYGYRKS